MQNIGASQLLGDGLNIGASQEAVLGSTLSKTFTVGASLRVVGSKTFTVGACLVNRYTKTFTVGATIIPSKEWLAIQEQVYIAELYEITLSIGTTYYYTSHDRDITWQGQTYEAIPITRGAINRRINLESETVEITINNLSGDLYDALQANILDASTIVIKQIFWDYLDTSYPDEYETTIFTGVPDVEFDRREVTLNVRRSIDPLNIQVPRELYQEPCNSALFDVVCGLTKATYEYNGTTTSAGIDRFTVTDTSLPVRKLEFDDATGTLSIGDTITGSVGAGTATIVNITYATAASGTLWYIDLTLPDFVDDEVLDDGGGSDITVNGTPEIDNYFYALGEIKFTSGDNNGQRRMIRIGDGDDLLLATAVPNNIANGVTFNIYPGCDKRVAETCDVKFSNKANHSGYPTIPKIEETIM